MANGINDNLPDVLTDEEMTRLEAEPEVSQELPDTLTDEEISNLEAPVVPPVPIKEPEPADYENTMKQRAAQAQVAVQQADAQAQAAKAQEDNPVNWTIDKVKKYYKDNPPKNIEEEVKARAAIKIKEKQVKTAVEALTEEEAARAPIGTSQEVARERASLDIADAKRAKAIDQGFIKGVAGVKEEYPELSQEHPVFTGISEIGGNLLGLSIAGGAVSGVSKKIITEGLAKYGIANLPKIMTAARVAGGAATFGTKEAFDKSVKALMGEGVTKDDAKDIVKAIGFGGVFGGIDSLPKLIMRVPSQALLGYSTAKMEGATTPDALINGAIFGAFGLLNRANLNEQYKKVGLNKIADTLKTRGEKAGMSKPEAEAAGNFFVNKSILNATGETDLNRAWDKISKDPKLTLKYLDEVDNFLRTYQSKGKLPEEARAVSAALPGVKPAGVEPYTGPGAEVPKPEIPVVRVKTSDLKVAPEKYQFKIGIDEAGVQAPIKGEYNPLAAGNLLVYETKDGNKYVVNGHHRLDLMKRSGVETANAQVVREADGVTPEEARSMAAETNILEGRGTVYDHAEYFKTSKAITEKEVDKRGLSKQGFNIGKKATDNTYYNFKSKKITPEAAEAIAVTAPNDDTIQNAGVDFAVKNQKADPVEVAAFTKAISMEKPVNSKEGDLFGFDNSAIKAAEAKAAVVSKKVEALKEELSALSFVKADQKIAINKKYGINVDDPKSVHTEIDRFKGEIERYKKWYSYPDLTTEVNKTSIEVAQKAEKKQRAADLQGAMRDFNKARRLKDKPAEEVARKKIEDLKPKPEPKPEPKNAEELIKDRGWDPDSVDTKNDGTFIVENTAGNKALLTELPISVFEKPKFETLSQRKYKPGKKITSPIEVTLENGKYIITDGANRFTQAVANGDKTIPVILEGYEFTQAKPDDIMYKGLLPETKKAIEKIWKDAPYLNKFPANNVNALAKEAEKYASKVVSEKQKVLNSVLQEIAKKHGAKGEVVFEYDGSTHKGYFGIAKSVKSMIIKVLRKWNMRRPEYNIASIKDHARGSIYVEDFKEVPAILQDLRSRGHNIEITVDRPTTGFGYRGINVWLPLGDGINGEIQIHTPSSWKLKEWSDKIYQPYRIYDGVDVKEVPVNVQVEMNKAMDLSSKTWTDYWSGVPAETKVAISSLDSGRASTISPIVTSEAGAQEPLVKISKPLLPPRTTLPSSNRENIVVSPSDKSISQEPEVVKATQEIGAEVDKTIEEMDKARRAGAASIGGEVPSAAKARGSDKVEGIEGASFDPKIERRWKEAKGIKEEFLPARLLEGIKAFFRQFKEFPMLENDLKYAQFKNDLRLLGEAKQIAQDKAIRALDGITFNLGKNKLDLFTRKIILDDLTYEASRGHDLPFGFTPETLRTEKSKIDGIVLKNTDIQAALDRRSSLLEAVKKELVDAGIMPEEAFKNPAYFRHQVLEYMEAQKITGRAKFGKTKPGYAKKRVGSELDINTDYLQAEFDWLANALKDIEVFKAVNRLENSPLNIKPELEQKAKEHNAAQMIGHEDEVQPYRQKIAMGFSTLRKLNYLPGQNDIDFVGFDTMGKLAEVAQGAAGEEEEAVIAARMVLKAIADRKKAIKNILGDEYRTWKDLIPEGYGLWQPKKGNLFFSGKTVSQAILDRIAEAGAGEFGISEDDLRQITIMGPKLKEIVLPQEIIDTIEDNYTTMPKSIIDKIVDVAVRVPMKLWKAQILFGPTRFFKYNYQNFIGDLSGMVAGNPHAITKVPDAIKGLWKYFNNPSGKIDPTLQDAIDRGVISTSLSIQELPEIGKLDIFKRYDDLNLADKLNVVKLWFVGASKFTRFREAVLRYAAYLDYLEKLNTGDYGKGPFKAFKYGASKPEEVEGIADPRDKAAKLSRELMVDYGAISPGGKLMRSNFIPFYSWLEGNFKRYVRLFANASQEGLVSGPGGKKRVAGVAAAQAGAQAAGYAGLWALRFAMFYAAAQAWNMLFHKDEEARVSEYDKRRLHIILGTDPTTGEVIVLRGQDAFGDFMEWFGLNTLPSNIEQYANKRISIGDLAGDMARSPYAKALNGISPGIKYPMALMTGREYNPETGKSTPVRDFRQYTARTLAIEAPYNIVSGKPHRPIEKEAETAFISRQDPQENAYRYIQGKKEEWNTKMGRGGSGDYYTPRSKFYQDYKRALRFGDQEAALNALKELQALGVKKKELIKSLKTADPLYGIPKKEKKSFVNKFLSTEDRQKLVEAYSYYRKTFRSKK